ncbi:hypothetical protein FQA39_LY03288 [Lamprigera yunnana]|nr:hypothetical protein FQA39_LY03288 [Lamprigera yunnana]
MNSIEEDIPAFPMWEMLNKTIIPALLNMEYSDVSLEKLTNIIKTSEFPSIFVYTQNVPMPAEEYEKKKRIYKAFTVWLLGQFFHLLSCDNLSKLHNLVFDAQVRILHYIGITQPYTYDELCAEYVSALKQLNSYHKEGGEHLRTLQIFQLIYVEELKNKLDLNVLPVKIPSKSVCATMQKRLIKVIYEVTLLNIGRYYTNNVVYESLDCLLYVLTECNVELKLVVLESCIQLVKNSPVCFKNLDENFSNKFTSFVSLFEDLIYKIYGKCCEVYDIHFRQFEEIVCELLLNCRNLSGTKENLYRIAVFVSSKTQTTALQTACFDYICFTPISLNLCDINDYIAKITKEKDYRFLKILKNQILNKPESEHSLYIWKQLSNEIERMLSKSIYSCSENCEFLGELNLLVKVSEMLMQVKIESRMDPGVNLFDNLVECLFVKLHNHVHICNQKNLVGMVIGKIFMLQLKIDRFEDIFYCFAHLFIKQFAIEMKTKKSLNRYQQINSFLVYTTATTIECALPLLCNFIHSVSSNLVSIGSFGNVNMMYIQSDYVEIIKKCLYGIATILNVRNLKMVLMFPLLFSIRDQWISEMILPALESLPLHLLPAVIESGGNIICQSTSHFLQFVLWNNDNVSFEICCLNCRPRSFAVDAHYDLKSILNVTEAGKMAYEVYAPLTGCNENLNSLLLKILSLCTHDDYNVKIAIIKSLKSLCHLPIFFNAEHIKLWFHFVGDTNKEIRLRFAASVFPIFNALKRSKTMPIHEKEVIIKTCFLELKNFTKVSLENSDVDLQYTLLETIGKFSNISFPSITENMTQILLYYIMIPTSFYPLIATNIFCQLAKSENISTSILYQQYKKQLNPNIMKMCVVNQALIDYSLVTSLEKICVVFGFYSSKDFILKENRHLVPILFPLMVEMPKVEKLLIELSTLLEISLSELLTSRYGHIFIHLFLNEPEGTYQKLTKYIEKTSGKSGKMLRKKDLLIILNELLTNFYEKKERVLHGLGILAREDSGSQMFSFKQIPDYLNPRLLGVLAYFDMKLMGRYVDKRMILLSLAELIKFMGPKYITPLRYKILAMLKTALNWNDESFSELNCDVWEAFFKSCDIDALGPQLASIFVSLLPLLQSCSFKVTDIFKYLIVNNESVFKDYICDLFFVPESEVINEICVVIKKYVALFENMPFREHLKSFMKYLNHETVDIRVYSLKYIKMLLEKNREELDKMILGYNGIDSVIVDLLDILMFACREKDDVIKLACGECIGELAAIDPSRFPRRYTQEVETFVFSMAEDAFIVNALNELVRALQSEKNTQNMDRIALAIQEMLKTHGISPDVNSSRYYLWNDFSESQQEVMLPLLSSRYTMVQPVEKIQTVPIYGSQFGSTFLSWVSNWTCNLILEIKPNERSLLQVCVPSFKQDNKTLMTFLPHIVLQALLDGTVEVHNSIYEEFMAVIDSFSKREAVPPISNINPLLNNVSVSSNTISPEGKVIFVILDFLDRWIRERKWKKGVSSNKDTEYVTVNQFFLRFCKLRLAKANYQCEEYARALMYVEEYIKEQPSVLKDQFSFLTELYAQLDEPDGISGVIAMQDQEPPLEQHLLSLVVSGKLAEAIACYELIPRPLKPHDLQCLIRCYLDLDNLNSALHLLQGALCSEEDCKSFLLETQAEPLWRLGRYTDLDNLLQKMELQNNHNWPVEMGRSLLHLHNGKKDDFCNVLNALTIDQVELLGAASLKEGAYERGYTYVARLHAINELKQVVNVINEIQLRPNDNKVCESVVQKLMCEWELRLKVVQESTRIQEPILCLRRVGIEQAKQLLSTTAPNSLPLLNSMLGEAWLQSSVMARSAGVLQQSFTYNLKAKQYAPPRLFLETAKLHWLREEHEQALKTLQSGLGGLLLDSNTRAVTNKNIELCNKKILAETKLLIASYNNSISNVDIDVNKQHYKDAVDVYEEWEKSMVSLAQYYDRLFQTLPENEQEKEEAEMKILMINYFGRSLLYGSEYVYQSMPRMLTIWFDYGTTVSNISTGITISESGGKKKEDTLLRMTKLIDTYLERLPSYIFLTAFSQIISRICHPQKLVSKELTNIIVKLILQYPQQTLWMLISIIKSRCPMRSRRCTEILNDGRLRRPDMIQLIGDFTKLAEKLIELCNKEIPENIQVTYVSSLLRSLPRMLEKDGFSEIMIPTQKFRKLILPNPDFQNTCHNPFPNHYVHIVGIEDEITVLQSLQRPRKITFRGSDGRKYTQMLKPKDDLRKDFRLMEFNDIVNQLLLREPNSRQRRLHIRLYSVAPLNEECGLLEWIPNLLGLRPTLLQLYKQRGLGVPTRELKNLYCDQKDPLSKKHDRFVKSLLPKYPPIFNEWFRKTFPDPQSWLSARTSYIHTTAAISMVGYILGLGDRHGENILFDSTCGDTVHVDFNCLFNKGETLQWPERVPFRLTHNMVAAMGPLGVEGIFRKSCACTLSVLREHTNTLMSIVTPFVYDPLVSWSRKTILIAEQQNSQAVEHIRNIEQRLRGITKSRKSPISLPLSVDGQTNHLIQEAMSIDNLCQMYIGWGAYL